MLTEIQAIFRPNSARLRLKFVDWGQGSAARPLECIQREGELLYVPEGWYHATVNLGDTVAVASQRLHQSAADMLHREHWLWSEAKDQVRF